jgi:hypothetical protein
MFKKTLKFLLGIISIPVCIAVSLSLFDQLKSISYDQNFFVYGAIAYLIVQAVVFKPDYLYIFGHEAMHAVAAWLSGGKVNSFKVSSKGGQVRSDKSNIFIALAPYFVPFYTILVAVIFFILSLLLKDGPPYNILMFLVGFTLAFHIILTIDFLKIRQTDLLHAGYLFSICLIYILNLVIICFILSLMFSAEINFAEFVKMSFFSSKHIYVGIFRQLFL